MAQGWNFKFTRPNPKGGADLQGLIVVHVADQYDAVVLATSKMQDAVFTIDSEARIAHGTRRQARANVGPGRGPLNLTPPHRIHPRFLKGFQAVLLSRPIHFLQADRRRRRPNSALVLRPLHQFGQLRDVRRDTSRFITREQFAAARRPGSSSQ